MWGPCGTFLELKRITLTWCRPGPTIPAASDGRGRIWLDPCASDTEIRCLLTHELVHLERRHRGCQPAAVERAVRAESARRLIPLPRLAEHLPWARALPELADELCVTTLVARDRLENLTPAELEQLSCLELQHP